VTSTCRILALAALSLWLAACASTPRRTPTPLPAPPAPGTVSDAVPRIEPRSSHGNPPFYDVNGRRYQVLASADGYAERGVASWYGPDFHGHSTSSGERYDMYAMTAAHRTLPIPCYARITNLANGRSVVVRINDRGPFVANRVVDLSYAAATRLDIVRTGTAFVELRTLAPGPVAAPTAPAAESAPESAPGATPEPPLAPVPNMPTLPVPPALAVALYIQVGAFADQNNAQRVIDRLQSAGLPHVFSLAGSASGRALRRVRIGPIATVEEFDQLAARLTALGYPDARLAND
jgi:rare lipoprotein A